MQFLILSWALGMDQYHKMIHVRMPVKIINESIVCQKSVLGQRLDFEYQLSKDSFSHFTSENV
jgi:hypothetical protein